MTHPDDRKYGGLSTAPDALGSIKPARFTADYAMDTSADYSMDTSADFSTEHHGKPAKPPDTKADYGGMGGAWGDERKRNG